MDKKWAFLITLVSGIALCPPAQAQGSITECKLSYLGSDIYTGQTDIGKDDCETKSVTFTVVGMAGTSYTAYTGRSCGNQSTTDCLQIEESREISSTGSDTFEVEIKTLVEKYDTTCEQTTQTIYVRLFYQNVELIDTPVECTALKIDTEGPQPPTGLKGEPGENAIKVSWEASDGATKYKVFYKVLDDCEATVEAAAKALESALTAIASNPDAQVLDDEGFSDANIKKVTDFKHSENSDDTDVTLTNKAEPGEELLISVKALDNGGNESLFSIPICVRVIRTYGFCDVVDNCEDGCAVSTVGEISASTGAGIVIALLTLFALVRARRRSRS
ncbi:MAG: hypothetical protein JXA30_00225 [Deltaproteobacteria bacterium]|nr:hypothetical protein [Deltaproteobacteria bacterium]